MSGSFSLSPSARVLVIGVARIGDTLLLTPVLRALHEALPQGAVDVIAHPKRAEVLRGLTSIRRLRGLTKYGAALSGWWPGREYEAAFVFGRDRALLQYALRVAHKVVAFRQHDDDLNQQLAAIVEWPTALLPAVDDRLQILAPVGLANAVNKRVDYVVSAAERAAAQAWRRATVKTPRLVGLQTASFPTKPYRDWPQAHFAALAQQLLNTYDDVSLLLFGDGSDVARAQAIAAGHPRAHVVAGQLTLRQSAALMAELDLYIGVDTGPTHLAGALGIPMVALYHALHPGQWLSPQQHPAPLVVIEQPAPADPSTPVAAPVSMNNIPVAAVWQAAQQILERKHA